jgi:hypothetical protein
LFQEGELIAYMLFGFGFIVSLISVIGILGVRQGSIEFLRVYLISLFLIAIAESALFLSLYGSIDLFNSQGPLLLAFTLTALVIELAASASVFFYQRILVAAAHSFASGYNSMFE